MVYALALRADFKEELNMREIKQLVNVCRAVAKGVGMGCDIPPPTHTHTHAHAAGTRMHMPPPPPMHQTRTVPPTR